jgi:hypothetical protein
MSIVWLISESETGKKMVPLERFRKPIGCNFTSIYAAVITGCPDKFQVLIVESLLWMNLVLHSLTVQS